MRDFPWRMFLAFILALAAAGGVGYYAWELREDNLATRDALAAARDEARDLPKQRERVTALTDQLEICIDERKAETARCAEAETQVEAMREDLDATRAELDEVRKQRTEAAKRLAAFRELTEKFQKMIAAGRIDVAFRDGRMLVKLPASVLFESGSAELSRDGELALMEVAVVLRDFTDRQFMVIGHTDDRPLESAEKSRYRNNWELSVARAVTVVNFLVEARMKPDQLIAAGLGAHDPIANNKTAEGRQENRRIEIVLLPTIEEMPKMPEELAEQAPAESKPDAAAESE